MSITINDINKAAVRLLIPISLEETYELIVQQARRLTRSKYGSLFLLKEDRLERVFASNPELFSVVIREKGNIYKSFTQATPLVIDDEEFSKIHPKLKEIGIKQVITIPLSYNKKSIGIMSFQSIYQHSFSKEDLNYLKLFGSLTALKLRNVQLVSQLQDALQARDLFISIASHELRTPITSIIGYANMLQGTAEREKVWIQDIRREAMRLSILITELFTVNQMKAGTFQYEFEECSINEIVERSISSASFSYPLHLFLFTKKVPKRFDRVVADANKLQQVMTNIIANAAKYSDAGSTVHVKGTYKEQWLTITVRDEGIGIAKQDLNNIFDSFVQGRNHNSQGMGLGLYLAKNIIEAHKGDIAISSQLNQGSTVEIKLPISHIQ